MKKKILFVLPNLNGGGAERVTVNIIKLLDEDFYDVKLLLVSGTGVLFEDIPKSVELICINKKKVRSALPKLSLQIHKINPDIIFSTINRVNIIVLIARFFVPRAPEIYVREPNLPSSQIKNGTLSSFEHFLIKFLYPGASKVIAQTDQMKNEINKYFGVSKEKIFTLTNPLNKSGIDKNISKSESPFEHGYLNFVAVGRLCFQKGFDALIKAFSSVVRNNPTYRLYIIGEGEERDRLTHLINIEGLAGNVFLKGFVSNPHVYIKHANALILSSRWEGLPNVVLESLYIGTPVVMTKVNPYCEKIITDNAFGFVVDDISDLDKLGQVSEIKNVFYFESPDLKKIFG